MPTHTTTPSQRTRRYPVPVGLHLDEQGHAALAAEAENVGLSVAAMARVLLLDALRGRRVAQATEPPTKAAA